MSLNQTDPKKWVDEYGDALYSFAITRVMNPEIAEDLVQDTFLSALKGLKDFEQKSTLKTWLISILKRKIIDYFRKKSTTHEKLTDDLSRNWEPKTSPFLSEGEMKGAWKPDRLPKHWDFDEDRPIEQKEFYKILHKCLSFLPPKWASCFVMKVMDELPTEEVCKDLKITTSNLWVMLHRARHQLRECMEKNWLGD